MIPQKVTIEISQYKLLNNIIYLKKRICKFDPAVNPLCSLCSHAPEDIVHLFRHCQITQKLWELLRSMLHGHITLPDLDPTLAVIDKLCIENNNNLIVDQMFLFSRNFFTIIEVNHSRVHNAALKFQLKSAEKVEQKIASKKAKWNFI